MLDSSKLRDLITDAIKGHNADYIEVHFEESEISGIGYRGKELDNITSNTSVGGNVRAQFNGGWGFVSFDQIEGIKERAAMAVEQARLVGGKGKTLASVEPVVSITGARLIKDPASISLAAKKRLLDEYNDIIYTTPGIQTSTIGYTDARRTKIFASSEGSFIQQSRVDVMLRLNAIARKDSEVQQFNISLGGLGDYSVVENLQQQVKETAEKAVALLSAPRVKGGKYPVVLDPVLAGVFVHEAFGHLSESDFIYENERLREIMVLGRQFGGKHLNIVDDASHPGLRGSYAYDDEGTPGRKVFLIKEGILTGRLHSRETAARMGEQPTGNARAINYHFPPIVRMSNTYIEPGTASFSDLISDIKEGIYAGNWYGGTTSMEMFTFSAGEAHMIRHGKIAELVRPVVLTGNVFETLKNIDAIGNDLDMNQGGGCGKGGQSPLPVSNGSPHIRINNCLVGGE